MISSRSSSAQKHRDSGSTVPAEAPWQCKPEFNTDMMDGDNKILTSEMQVEQNSLCFSRVSGDQGDSHSVRLATPVETR